MSNARKWPELCRDRVRTSLPDRAAKDLRVFLPAAHGIRGPDDRPPDTLIPGTATQVRREQLPQLFRVVCQPRLLLQLPRNAFEETHTPNPNTPLGAKDAGESGCIGTPPAVVGAVIDALDQDDPSALQMPLTPERCWEIMQLRSGKRPTG